MGAQRDAEELKGHPFFKTIDWAALAAKQITPPFIPQVESDESTACFDPEFTSTDLRDVGIDNFDEDDPSGEWVAQSFTGTYIHTPNGPLGSDIRDLQANSQTNSGLNSPSLNGPTGGSGKGSGSSGNSGSTTIGTERLTRPPLEILSGKKRRNDAQGSPLSNSVQENFRGFSFSGESFVDDRMVEREGRDDDEDAPDGARDAEDDSDSDDSQPSGRVASRRGDEFVDL